MTTHPPVCVIVGVGVLGGGGRGLRQNLSTRTPTPVYTHTNTPKIHTSGATVFIPLFAKEELLTCNFALRTITAPARTARLSTKVEF